MRNALAPLDDNHAGSRYVPVHKRGKDPARRQSEGGTRTQLHGRPALPVARWEELRGGKASRAVYAKGPDGTRGFVAGRGKPLCPAATPALQRGRAIFGATDHDSSFGAADHESVLQPYDPPLVETPVAPHNHVSIFGAADDESVLQSPYDPPLVETPAAQMQNHESIFDLLQSPNDPTFVETPVAAQNEPKPRRLPAPQQNESKFHRLPPGLGMTPVSSAHLGQQRPVAKPVAKPVAMPVATEKKEAAEVEMDAMETALETTLARARQASSRARELNAALLACSYEEDDVTAPEAVAPMAMAPVAMVPVAAAPVAMASEAAAPSVAAVPEAAAPEPPVAAPVAPVAAPATAPDQTTTHEEDVERESQAEPLEAAGVAEEPSLHASPPKACQVEGDQDPGQADGRVELVEPCATTQPLAAPLVTAHVVTTHVPRTRAPRPTLRRRATTNVGHHLPTFLRNAANARFFSKVADSALCVLTLALTSW